MKKYIFIPILFSMLWGWACTDLNEDLYDKIPAETYPENADQVAGLAVDAYTKLKDLIDDNGWWFLAQELSSDGSCGPTRDTDWDDGGKWRVLHQHEWTNDVDAVNSMWSNLYDGVTRCNQILDRMREFVQTDDVIKIMAEVETMRALYYYLLIDNYGDVPYLTSAVGAPAEPFKAKREAVFDSLVVSLNNNIPKLSAVDKKYLANRYMAQTLLAKLYINSAVYTGVQKWQEASDVIDEILDGPYSLEDDVLAPFKTNNENSSEIIFAIPFDEDNYQGFRIHMRTLHYLHNLTYDLPVGPWNGLAATKQQFDLYEDNDLRKEGYFIYGPQKNSAGQPLNDTGNPAVDKQVVIDPFMPALWMKTGSNTYNQIKYGGARVGKYEIKKGAKENLSNDFPLFRLTDVMLMKAEVEIRINGDGSGDVWIEPIRNRAGVEPFIGANLNQLIDERGRELWMEGHRRQDQIRFNQWNKAWWEKEAKTDRETFPIPKWATDANKNLLESPK